MMQAAERQARQPRRIDLVRVLEAGVGIGLALLGLAHFVLHLQAMSTTGLWNDEIESIRAFSSQGVWVTLTSYPAPNNHIFFNALNALLPWRDPFEPSAARLWSFVSVGLLGAVGFAALARRRSFLEAGLFVHLLFMSREFLALGLQARGYGLVSFFTLLAGLLVWRHERKPQDPSAMLALGGVALLGIWTIPSFVLFAAPLLAMTCWTGALRRNLGIATGAGALTLLVHLPVARQILDASRRYSGKWGRQLDTPTELFDTLRLYLFHDESFVLGPNDTAIALLIAGLALLALRSRASAEGRTASILTLSAMTMMLACLALGTPPPRTLAPVMVAFALAAVLVLRDRMASGPPRALRAGFAAGLALILFPHDRAVLEAFDFVPRERWMSIAAFIDHTLPQDMPVAVPYRKDQLAIYTQRKTALIDTTEPTDLFEGRAGLLRSGHDDTTREAPHVGDPRLAAIRFKQNRGRHQTLYLGPPSDSGIARIELLQRFAEDDGLDLAAATDGDLRTSARTERPIDRQSRYVEIDCELSADRRVRSMIAAFDPDAPVGRIRIDYQLDDGSLHRLPQEQIAIWGNVVAARFAASLPDTSDTSEASDTSYASRIERVMLHVRPRTRDARRVFSLRELWFYPDRLSERAGGPD